MQSTDSMQFPSKFQYNSLKTWKKTIINYIWKNKISRMAKIILNNKRTSEGIPIPDLKLCYRATVIKTAWCWYRDR